MNVVIFEGYLGAGKTNGMVLFSKIVQSLSPQTVLYSNFGVKDSLPFTSLYDFYDVADQPSSIVMLDEAHVDLDSRSFSSNHVKFFSQTSFYLRKLRCTLAMTSPLYESLDSRIRGITNLLYVVSKDNRYFYYDIYDIQSGRYLRRYKINQVEAFKLDLYDTNSIVTPVDMPENKKAFDEFLVSLKQRTEQYYQGPERSRRELATIGI